MPLLGTKRILSSNWEINFACKLRVTKSWEVSPCSLTQMWQRKQRHLKFPAWEWLLLLSVRVFQLPPWGASTPSWCFPNPLGLHKSTASIEYYRQPYKGSRVDLHLIQICSSLMIQQQAGERIQYLAASDPMNMWMKWSGFQALCWQKRVVLTGILNKYLQGLQVHVDVQRTTCQIPEIFLSSRKWLEQLATLNFDFSTERVIITVSPRQGGGCKKDVMLDPPCWTKEARLLRSSSKAANKCKHTWVAHTHIKEFLISICEELIAFRKNVVLNMGMHCFSSITAPTNRNLLNSLSFLYFCVKETTSKAAASCRQKCFWGPKQVTKACVAWLWIIIRTSWKQTSDFSQDQNWPLRPSSFWDHSEKFLRVVKQFSMSKPYFMHNVDFALQIWGILVPECVTK